MPYEIQVSEAAAEELATLRVFDQRRVVAAIRQLVNHAETATRNRRPLRAPVGALPEGTWQLRVGNYRVFYELVDGRIARVLRVILKRWTTEESL